MGPYDVEQNDRTIRKLFGWYLMHSFELFIVLKRYAKCKKTPTLAVVWRNNEHIYPSTYKTLTGKFFKNFVSNFVDKMIEYNLLGFFNGKRSPNNWYFLSLARFKIYFCRGTLGMTLKFGAFLRRILSYFSAIFFKMCPRFHC